MSFLVKFFGNSNEKSKNPPLSQPKIDPITEKKLKI